MSGSPASDPSFYCGICFIVASATGSIPHLAAIVALPGGRQAICVGRKRSTSGVGIATQGQNSVDFSYTFSPAPGDRFAHLFENWRVFSTGTINACARG